ncbi:MAG: amino acid carrier protein [Planctomycetota bacterium]
MNQIETIVSTINGLLFHNVVVGILLLTGLLFTIWTVFGQYRALTHGVSVVRGKYDDKNDPGAINHFQALSAALSATVGLGNIAGVAVAVTLGGPGAVLWMWLIGFLGMSLKMTEVMQSMLHRNTDDPDNPHGGPMFVVRNEFGKIGLRPLGTAIGGLFCLTLILSAITGGNMFQSFNVAEVTTQYITDIPRPAIGVFLAIVVGLVIIGGIKRIGSVAGKIVPLMCGLYLLAGIIVLGLNFDQIGPMLKLIVLSGLGIEPATIGGAFLGSSVALAANWGIKRALFSSEAGQGSSPIAHSAAKTDEPVREGVVAGLEPFIDTIVVCTVTALVILSTGAWNRGGEAIFPESAAIEFIERDAAEAEGKTRYVLQTPPLPAKTAAAKQTLQIRAAESGWSDGDGVFMVYEADLNEDQGSTRATVSGVVTENDDGSYAVTWDAIETEAVPVLVNREIYVTYIGAGLTAHAFDRAIPGLGKWLIILASWLFAVSTMISWSYYGEQGVHYLFGKRADAFIIPYKLVYCFLIFVSTLPFIQTEKELDMWTTLGLGAMLVVNIPIMLVFGFRAMGAYHEYMGRLKRGEMKADEHSSPSVTDVVEGKDVE